jgi:hypothetical protein
MSQGYILESTFWLMTHHFIFAISLKDPVFGVEALWDFGVSSVLLK